MFNYKKLYDNFMIIAKMNSYLLEEERNGHRDQGNIYYTAHVQDSTTAYTCSPSTLKAKLEGWVQSED